MAREGLTRRDFNVAAAAGAAGLTIAVAAGRAAAQESTAPQEASVESTGQAPAGAQKITHRALGKTGLMVSEISLGAMTVTDQAVIEKALDDGVTYIDTAASYQRGENEKLVGRVMATRRSQVVLATKWRGGSKEDYLASLDRSLEKLQTDHVDIIQLHGAKSADDVKDPVLKEAFDAAKAAGKARFMGITTHSNQAEVIQACIDAGYVDSMLIAYNSGMPELTDSVKRAREAGIGTVIMKPVQSAKNIKAAGNMTPYQMAIRWLLDQEFVDTVNVGMTSFAQLDEDLAASSLKMTALERLNMQRFAAACMGTMCGRCGACMKCARGVKPAEILRAHMYAFEYGNREFAMEQFLEMGGPQMLAACVDCGACERACPRNLNIRERFRKVASLLA